MQGNAVNLEGYSQINFAVSTSAAQSSPLMIGTYDVWCDVDCWIAVGLNPQIGLTSANGYKIFANQPLPVQINKNGNRIGAIAGGAGTFSYHQTGN